MHRLFVAIRPPQAVRERLLALMGGISGARWQTDEQLHLTLRFIGEVDRHRARDIDAALSAIHHPGFALSLDGLGCFDRGGEPATLWVGVSPIDPVKALHRKIDQAIARIGLEADRRAYSPHITLARLGRGAGPIAQVLETRGGFSSDPFQVDNFTLFESRLTPEGAVHTPLERYPLDRASPTHGTE
jgi:2'-5' RNA ligase